MELIKETRVFKNLVPGEPMCYAHKPVLQYAFGVLVHRYEFVEDAEAAFGNTGNIRKHLDSDIPVFNFTWKSGYIDDNTRWFKWCDEKRVYVEILREKPKKPERVTSSIDDALYSRHLS